MDPDFPKPFDQERSDLAATPRTQFDETQALGQRLLETIKAHLPELEKLFAEVSGHWHAEDGFYRFYHHSLKVFSLQSDTERIVAALQSLLPERALNASFRQIIGEGTGKTFDLAHNRRWLAETRPILEAFFHARAMLEYAIKHGRELQTAPQCLPSGWAAVLYLFDLR